MSHLFSRWVINDRVLESSMGVKTKNTEESVFVFTIMLAMHDPFQTGGKVVFYARG